MTLPEFNSEFNIQYNIASFGAPDLNSYEISLFLTQGVRDIINELYSNYEYSEYNKRALNPLVKVMEICTESDYTIENYLSVQEDYYYGFIAQEAILPSDLYYILQENISYAEDTNCKIDPDVIAEDLNDLNRTMKNPFKRPSKRKVLRTSAGGNNVRLYSLLEIGCYKIKYLKKYSPIVLTDFTTDPELIGTETIDGINSESMTELPVFLHDKIVKRGVILAIKSLRENNLKTQIEV